jgi:hypothetical protein
MANPRMNLKVRSRAMVLLASTELTEIFLDDFDLKFELC